MHPGQIAEIQPLFFWMGTEGKETNLIKWFMLSQGQSNVIILRWLSMYTTP